MLRVYFDVEALKIGKFSVDDDGLPYCNFEPTDILRDELVEHVRHATFRGTFRLDPVRSLGIYKLGDATAILDKNPNGNAWYSIEIGGRTFASVRDLYYTIRQGNIQPDIPWEERQSGLPRGAIIEELQGIQAALQQKNLRNFFPGRQRVLNLISGLLKQAL
jgi:hypothetical protein